MIRRAAQFEAAGWRLVNERPSAVAPPGGGDWRAFLLRRLDATVAQLLKDCASLASCEYGQMEPVVVSHPLSGALPLLSKLLDMPTRALAGDQHMPRVQGGYSALPSALRCRRAVRRTVTSNSRRALRAPAVAVLSQRLRRLGGRQADAIPAGPRHLSARAHALFRSREKKAGCSHPVNATLCSSTRVAYDETQCFRSG